MRDLLLANKRSSLIAFVLGIAAVIGWSAFAYSQQQVSRITAERDAALIKHQQLEQASGELNQVETKLRTARIEYSRVVQLWRDTKARTDAAQHELAGIAMRLEQARDRVSQTSSIRVIEPVKPSARKR